MEAASAAVMVLILTVTQWTIVIDIISIFKMYTCKYEKKVAII